MEEVDKAHARELLLCCGVMLFRWRTLLLASSVVALLVAAMIVFYATADSQNIVWRILMPREYALHQPQPPEPTQYVRSRPRPQHLSQPKEEMGIIAKSRARRITQPTLMRRKTEWIDTETR